MFWSFDQAGVFELLDSQDFDLSKFSSHDPAQTEALTDFRSRLEDQAVEFQKMNDVQAVDISVTRQWMRIILWRLAESHGFFSHGVENTKALLNDPILIAKELLSTLSRFPNTAIEAHGPGLVGQAPIHRGGRVLIFLKETKVFEIACTVADAITLGATAPTQPDQSDQNMAREVLSQLQKLLLKNKKLCAMLNKRVANDRQQRGSGQSPGSLQSMTADSKQMDFDIEQQLKAHGFDFTDPMVFGQSPDTESLSSDQVGRSPQQHSTQTLQQQQSNFSRGNQLETFLPPPQRRPGMQASSDQLRTTSGNLPSNFDQNFTDMDFDFNALPAGSDTSLGTFQDFGWPNYGILDQYPALNELPDSMQEASWPSEKHG